MSPWRRYKYFWRSQAKTQNILLFNACTLRTFYKLLEHLEVVNNQSIWDLECVKYTWNNVAIRSLASIIKHYIKNRVQYIQRFSLFPQNKWHLNWTGQETPKHSSAVQLNANDSICRTNCSLLQCSFWLVQYLQDHSAISLLLWRHTRNLEN